MQNVKQSHDIANWPNLAAELVVAKVVQAQCDASLWLTGKFASVEMYGFLLCTLLFDPASAS